jgi:hypothetical protein
VAAAIPDGRQGSRPPANRVQQQNASQSSRRTNVTPIEYISGAFNKASHAPRSISTDAPDFTAKPVVQPYQRA